ncbi:hypothetical protein AB4K20DRAFT_1985208 [Rhizopus microsporus]|uniref:Uncharacterized protein n=1 Tax=Rhizopus microsporus TaxID=58291 RepID=A0A1X0RPL7_RHIZD|nr:hypothetical protein BCV71DRAFT_277108 [Rhizopus microsporus]
MSLLLSIPHRIPSLYMQMSTNMWLLNFNSVLLIFFFVSIFRYFIYCGISLLVKPNKYAKCEQDVFFFGLVPVTLSVAHRFAVTLFDIQQSKPGTICTVSGKSKFQSGLQAELDTAKVEIHKLK